MAKVLRTRGTFDLVLCAAMVGLRFLDAALARVHMACGRIAGSAAAIVEAHAFGIPEGLYKKPWAAAYHRRAVRIYAQSFPRRYQHDIGALFSDSADTMAEQLIPARLAEDWVLVTKYMRAASEAIAAFHAVEGVGPRETGPTPSVDGPIPMVIRFDALARLTTTEGAERLGRAALAVQQHVDVPPPEVLSPVERRLLARVAAGAPVVELASELGFSERSTYRALADLWEKLGVSGRREGLDRATSEGLI